MLQEKLAIIANYMWKQSIVALNQTLSETEIRHFNMNDYYYLTVIDQMENPKLGQLADELRLTKPAISAIVKRLMKNDLIEKTQSEEDKRIFHLKVTEKGQKIIEGDYKSFKDLSELLEHTVSQEQLNVLNQVLDQVVDQLKENNAEE
ncbi:MarR family winged helix-turn-helix transcriptional regulator [Sporolactobacillus laevolacticus]|uniref:MarR family transcriptional regulator n=1 Tax=Sporolactobacillus laevolacticus DSM 442 TaxID=1395513 RepID=V6IYN9_9BACL|nr:MarR family transcriptional regulator [Sporolactobacillus laevolacticus]EST12608.1 MarR family transcriptional regulator [Sporolactobacillus laevolacticus DSM 442]